jgi:hypothetical protein
MRTIQNTFTGGLIGWLTAMAGWTVLDWKFWAVMLGWATVSFTCQVLEDRKFQ